MILFTKMPDTILSSVRGFDDEDNVLDRSFETMATAERGRGATLLFDMESPVLIDTAMVSGVWNPGSFNTDGDFVAGDRGFTGFSLEGSNDNVTYVSLYDSAVSSGVVDYGRSTGSVVRFPSTVAYRYYRMAFTHSATYGVTLTQVFLVRQLLDLRDYYPIVGEEGVHDSAVSYRLWNRRLVYYTEHDSESKRVFNLDWQHLPNNVVDQLKRLWKGPPLLPEFTLFFPYVDNVSDPVSASGPWFESSDPWPLQAYLVKPIGEFRFEPSLVAFDRARVGAVPVNDDRYGESVSQYRRGVLRFEEV